MTESREDQTDADHDEDPNDPRHPDHDLSEAAPLWIEPASVRPWFTSRGFLVLVAIVVILGLLLPSLRIIL